MSIAIEWLSGLQVTINGWSFTLSLLELFLLAVVTALVAVVAFLLRCFSRVWP